MNRNDKKLPPLYYAIVLHFLDGRTDDASGVVEVLGGDYGGYRLLNAGGVEEALATARENGLLEEAGYRLDEGGELRIDYEMTEFGRDMVQRYLL